MSLKILPKVDFVSPKHTLIIIDWDDTLYPTSWSMKNNIDLTNPNMRYKYQEKFKKLDNELNECLTKMKKHGEVIIISNATPAWIHLSVSVLPKTQKCLSTIDVISARARYQNTDMTEWKKLTFIDELASRKKNTYTNILSFGDAMYEHEALINLYDSKKYLKSIKLISLPNYNNLLQQIKMIREHINYFCTIQRHLDYEFKYE